MYFWACFLCDVLLSSQRRSKMQKNNWKVTIFLQVILFNMPRIHGFSNADCCVTSRSFEKSASNPKYCIILSTFCQQFQLNRERNPGICMIHGATCINLGTFYGTFELLQSMSHYQSYWWGQLSWPEGTQKWHLSRKLWLWSMWTMFWAENYQCPRRDCTCWGELWNVCAHCCWHDWWEVMGGRRCWFSSGDVGVEVAWWNPSKGCKWVVLIDVRSK